jgi:hypothetical protein
MTRFTGFGVDPADGRAKRSQDRDDVLAYYVYRCPVCDFTTARMALSAARGEATRHEARHGASLFAGSLYLAEPKRRWDRLDELRTGYCFW